MRFAIFDYFSISLTVGVKEFLFGRLILLEKRNHFFRKYRI